jgi:F-type H+-transporting ATPase subunit b
MEGIIKAFYIDWHLMIAQLINFSIVIIVLWRFAYRPVLKVLKERSDKIAQGLDEAQKAKESFVNATVEKGRLIKEAEAEKQKIIDDVLERIETVRKEKSAEARAEAETIVSDAQAQIRSEREKMLVDLRRELGELVTLAAGKLTRSRIDEKTDQGIIDDALEDLKKEQVKIS